MSVAPIVPTLLRRFNGWITALAREDLRATPRREAVPPQLGHWCMDHEVSGPVCGPTRTRPHGGRGPIPGGVLQGNPRTRLEMSGADAGSTRVLRLLPCSHQV